MAEKTLLLRRRVVMDLLSVDRHTMQKMKKLGVLKQVHLVPGGRGVKRFVRIKLTSQ